MNESLKHRKPGFFTIDVEDYYHIIGVSGTPPISQWDSIPSRVEYGLHKLLDLLELHNVKATLFFLGYIAKRFPHLVTEAQAMGHEIASHGMYHLEVRLQTSEQFYQDARDSRLLLEDLSGVEVRGWRSAGFSMSQRTPWFFEKLLAAGYSYDSSVVPSRLGHHRLFVADSAPSRIGTGTGRIYEFPISVVNFMGIQVSMFGGCYLRFFPQKAIVTMADKTLKQRPLMIYIHPRELDQEHPRIKMNLVRRYKSYINLSTVPTKLETLLGLTNFLTLGEYYDQQKQS